MDEKDLEKDVMQSCKTQVRLHIEKLLELGVRKQNIEIDLHFYIKELLKNE